MSWKRLLKGFVNLIWMEHRYISCQFLSEDLSVWVVPKAVWHRAECLRLQRWSAVAACRCPGLTQNRNDRLAEVVSPAPLCNQPFQPIDFALPLANEDTGSYGFCSPCMSSGLQDPCLLLCLVPLTATGAQDAKKQEQQKQQNKLTSDLQTVSSQLVWQTPDIKPFISSLLF